MGEALKKYSDTAAPSSEIASPAPLQDDKKLWKRQEGESVMWFNRFRRYLALGPKRSLKAAVEEERSQVKALKSTKEGQSEKRTEGKARAKRGQAAQIAPVAPLPVQVPGSWKAASVTWRWVERARAWDNHAVDFSVNKYIERFLEEGFALASQRVKQLNTLASALLANYDANSHKMSFEQDCLYMGRIQSILRDIREEMKTYDESVHREVLRRRIMEEYRSITPEEIAARNLTGSSKK